MERIQILYPVLASIFGYFASIHFERKCIDNSKYFTSSFGILMAFIFTHDKYLKKRKSKFFAFYLLICLKKSFSIASK